MTTPNNQTNSEQVNRELLCDPLSNDNGIEGVSPVEQADQARPHISEVLASLGNPQTREEGMSRISRLVIDRIDHLDGLKRSTDKTTVEGYHESGTLLNEVARVLRNKIAYSRYINSFVREGKPSDREVMKQMRRIAWLDPEDLQRYSSLGKNRCLQVIYLASELEEYNDGTASPATVKQRLRQLEALAPYPDNSGEEETDVMEFRVHMDAIVTKYRIESATGQNDWCGFDKAKRIARMKKKALEKSAAASLAEYLATQPDLDRGLQNWIENRQETEESMQFLRDPKTAARKLANVQSIAERILENEDSLASVRGDESLRETIIEAGQVIERLCQRLSINEDCTIDEVTA